MKVVYYAHGGGYTEIGGIQDFLRKIRNDIEFKRIFPAVNKPPKKSKIKHQESLKLKDNEEGITGKDLFKRLRERIEIGNYKDIVLIVIDDGDCLYINNEEKFINALTNFASYLNRQNIKYLFLFFEPEIEKIFCIDKSWEKNKNCGEIDLYRRLDNLLENINFELNETKTSCKEKFSLKFAQELKLYQIHYSKKNNGSEYLKKISPHKVAERDNFVKDFINKLEKV